MGDHKNKALQEKPMLIDLETLYLGIPDESVNLTFQDLADLKSEDIIRKPTIITTDPTRTTTSSPSPNFSHPLAKIPSLDFSRGLQATNQNHHQHQHHQDFSGHGGSYGGTPLSHSGHGREGHQHHHDTPFSHASSRGQSPRGRADQRGDHLGYSMSYDDMSVASGRSGGGVGGRRRPGVPHSKICTICSSYAYVFRTRCLVCGRAYCWRCVQTGMGEMIEGRKCIECLGLRFSQRYIARAGKVGCCSWRYPATTKQAELICAEKGPKRSRRSYGHDQHHSPWMVPTSRSKSPIITQRSPTTTTHSIGGGGNNEHSFVISSSFVAASPRHHLPF